ncbi:MAG: NAD(P)-dependent glycerol-3-phosphate dehydrogenase [Candidatus Margulisbacteria bacterium]|nr:NAD(P)-dependent glycerol-3-phosphate dehydrogenase [Candidatus Margulisiibacteriota bacterium]MBU1022052.1 NAD(P)-dependent glycerol-3-phosphate dehydrogenase [Candidatus Margulisiibacteriota bacterium]MBU1729647.1 NAD(P)-dependent glycerol-3-phosphate dehydrogenase [Candidatus Margulisiibacteriota bacterium]MBU1954967.1 NAD(P)-dependent glycerol-3-phosphate dehydrogenase [Candidatus Margulisiibacteriota bacterium]
MSKVVIFGAGSWGTTLASLLAENNHDVTIWSFEAPVAKQINEMRENQKYLPGIQLSSRVQATANLESAANQTNKAAAVFFVVPSEHLRKVAAKLKGKINNKIPVISATKGIEKNTFKRMSQILAKELKHPSGNICVLSGPNLSKEIAKGLPATTVIASTSKKSAQTGQKLLMQSRFRVYTNRDVEGVEFGGALKNVIAIAAGAAEGLSLGDNAKSALLVRGIAEIARLGKHLGAKTKTFYGLSGFGDLITTCQSKLSRNHKVGVEIAQGKKLAEILASMPDVAEGVPTAAAATALAKKLKIDMPITFEVYKVLFENKDPYQALSDLMNREAKEEK